MKVKKQGAALEKVRVPNLNTTSQQFQNKHGMIDPKNLERLKESFKRSPIRISKRMEIINLFLTSKNNTVPEICRKLNVSRQIVNMTLDRYFEILQTKKNK